MAKHYRVIKIDGTPDQQWDTIKNIFADGPDDMNWVIGSTSGIHGTYNSLDSIEKDWDEAAAHPRHENHHQRYFTLLVIHPRMVCLVYGHIFMRTLEDVKWMRQAITHSLIHIRESQNGNLDLNLLEEIAG